MFQERVQCLREAGKVLYDVSIHHIFALSLFGINKTNSAPQKYLCSFTTCIEEANGSAAVLVNLLADNFPCFRDKTRFEGKEVRFYKRAQILVADLWACFRGKSYGKFHDIDKLTMFAGMIYYFILHTFSFPHFPINLPSHPLPSTVDLLICYSYMFPDYRIPQMLHTLGCLLYSPPLETHIRQRKPLPSGHKWETELRGTSIWCIELIRREIEKQHSKMMRPGVYAELTPQVITASGSAVASGSVSVRGGGGEGDDEKEEVKNDDDDDDDEHGNEACPLGVNAVLIDFLLYDTIKELEGEGRETIPHHRTRSIWY